MELAQWCGVQIQEVQNAIQLFPANDNITLSPNVVAALEKVPYAKSEEEYTEQFRRADEKLGQELDSNVYIFAKRLYEICSLKKMETHVDDLLSIILVLGEFYRSPLSFRQKPKLMYKFNELELVSVPDYAIFRAIHGNTLPEIVGVAVENKTITEKPALGQAIGTALACSLHNYLMNQYTFAIPVIRGRGVHLSFMTASFSSEFMDVIQEGTIPFNAKANVLLYPKRPIRGPLEYEGRKEAFNCLAYLRHFVLQQQINDEVAP